jgi:hypothetical protein
VERFARHGRRAADREILSHAEGVEREPGSLGWSSTGRLRRRLVDDLGDVPRRVPLMAAVRQQRVATMEAQITYKLFQGRKYIVRLRLYYPGQSGKTSITVF